MSLINYGVALIIAIGAAYGIGRHNGYELRKEEDEAAIAQKSQEMNQAKEKADADLYQAKQQIAAKGKQLTDAIRSGQQQLFIPITTPSGCTPSASGNGETRAELDKSVAEALVKIALDGDKSITYLNSCIDRYNQVRDISGKRN